MGSATLMSAPHSLVDFWKKPRTCELVTQVEEENQWIDTTDSVIEVEEESLGRLLIRKADPLM
jgi:hypothetical protein